MMEAKPLLGGVELGGTKCVCLIGTGPDDIRVRVSVPTGNDPQATMRRIEKSSATAYRSHGPIRALGIASFGPVDLSRQSPTYGCITSTGKPGWRDTPVATPLAQAFQVPVGFDTDVNGAAVAEGRWGAAKGCADYAFVTVGTGVGVGLVVNGCLAHGFGHPELGHIRIARMSGRQLARQLCVSRRLRGRTCLGSCDRGARRRGGQPDSRRQPDLGAGRPCAGAIAAYPGAGDRAAAHSDRWRSRRTSDHSCSNNCAAGSSQACTAVLILTN